MKYSAALEHFWASDPQLAEPGARLYALDQSTFRQQLQTIAAAGYVTPRDWESLSKPSDRPTIALTFDDGHRSNEELAWPVLNEFGFKGIFFITTGWTGQAGFMSAGQIRKLHANGMLIGAHGETHRYLSDLSATEQRRELTDSKKKLEDIIGAEIPAMALPGGRNHARLQALAREIGYRHLFTSRIAVARADENPLDWPRIPITNRQSPQFLADILAGNYRGVERMARSARLRGLAKHLLGNRLYDRVRGAMIQK